MFLLAPLSLCKQKRFIINQMDNKTIHKILTVNDHRIPMVIYDVDVIKRQKTSLDNLFKNVVKKFTIAYSYKTNTALGQTMRDLDCSFQVTSINHLRQVKQLTNKKPFKIFFNSRNLTKKDLKEVIHGGVHLIINSRSQYDMVQELATKQRQKLQIGVRIDTKSLPKNTFFKTVNTGLGLDYQEFKGLPRKSKCLEIVGLHAHIASQNTDLLSIEKGIKVLSRIFEQNNFNFRYLNLGGGFPIQYKNSVPTIKSFAEKIIPAIRKIQKPNPSLEFIIEPGRYIVGPAGYLFARVNDIISNHGKIDVAVINCSVFSSVRDRILSGYVIELPCVVFKKQKIETKKYLIVGSSPSSCDTFGKYVLPKVRIGDILIFSHAGAYCLSNDDFTGVEKPQEFVWTGNHLLPI